MVGKQKIINKLPLAFQGSREGKVVAPNHQNTPRPGLHCPTESRAEIPEVMVKWFTLPSHIRAAQRSRILLKPTPGKAFCTSRTLAPCSVRYWLPSSSTILAVGRGTSAPSTGVLGQQLPAAEQGICTSHSCTANNKLYKAIMLVMRLPTWEKHTHSKLADWFSLWFCYSQDETIAAEAYGFFF